MVFGTPNWTLTGCALWIETSTPFCVRSKRFVNDALIVSVKTSVPTTKATPTTTAKPVRTDRSLRESRPRSATLVIPSPLRGPCSARVGLRRALVQGRSCDRFHQVEHAVGVGARAVMDHRAIAQDHEPVGDRRRLRVVGDHDHRLLELVDRLAQEV